MAKEWNSKYENKNSNKSSPTVFRNYVLNLSSAHEHVPFKWSQSLVDLIYPYFPLAWQGWQTYITQVVNQVALNLKRIQGLGVKKLVVSGLEPLGCLPHSTFTSSFQRCNGTENSLVNIHNMLLQQAVTKLNNQTKGSKIVILDLYGAFMTVFKNKGDHLVYYTTPILYCSHFIISEVLLMKCRRFKVWEAIGAMLYWNKHRIFVWKHRWEGRKEVHSVWEAGSFFLLGRGASHPGGVVCCVLRLARQSWTDLAIEFSI